MKSSFSKFFGLGEKSEVSKIDQNDIQQLPVTLIVPNRFQPRTEFAEERIDELAQTIKTHGIIQPIIVRKSDNKYEIIAGERRWRAVIKLGWETIPGIVRDLNDTQTASVALIENLQREQLSVIEEAVAYEKLIELHGLTQESLAQRLGRGQSTIANKLRLLKLPEVIQSALRDKQLTERHARAMLSLKDEKQQEQLLKEVIENKLNVKQTEERVKMLLSRKNERVKRPARKAYSQDLRIAVNTIRQSLDMVKESGLPIEMVENDLDECYEFLIRIPKK